MNEKCYLSASQLYVESFELGMRIIESGYQPDYIVGIWRGGAPIGIVVQELLFYLGKGVPADHISIRTSSYYEGSVGIRKKQTQVHGLGYLVKKVNAVDSLLIIDDVYDTGLSVQAVIKKIELYCRKNTPDIKIATLYYKPKNNKTSTKPDYYSHETDDWIVFPHELSGLTIDEIIDNKYDMGHTLKDRMKALNR